MNVFCKQHIPHVIHLAGNWVYTDDDDYDEEYQLQSVVGGLTNFISSIILEVDTTISPILLIKKSRHREFKKLSQIMELGRGSANIQTQAICAVNTVLLILSMPLTDSNSSGEIHKLETLQHRMEIVTTRYWRNPGSTEEGHASHSGGTGEASWS